MSAATAEFSLESLSKFQDRLVENIKGFFGSMIPDETIKKIVEKEWKAFTVGLPAERVNGPSGNSWDYRDVPAREPILQNLIRSEMEKQIRLKVEAWGKEWGASPEADTLAAKTIKEASVNAARVYQETLATNIMVTALANFGLARCGNCQRTTLRQSTCVCGYHNS